MRAEPRGWSGLSIVTHWLAAALMVALLAIGWAMLHAGLDMGRTFELFQLHKSLGFVLLAVTAVRLLARAGRARPADAAGAPRWESALSQGVQAGLYVLTLLAIVLGWWVVSCSPLPVPTRLFGLVTVPDLPASNPEFFGAARQAHAFAAYAIAGLVILHVCGALKHALWDRDDILGRMLWPRTQRKG